MRSPRNSAARCWDSSRRRMRPARAALELANTVERMEPRRRCIDRAVQGHRLARKSRSAGANSRACCAKQLSARLRRSICSSGARVAAAAGRVWDSVDSGSPRIKRDNARWFAGGVACTMLLFAILFPFAPQVVNWFSIRWQSKPGTTAADAQKPAAEEKLRGELSQREELLAQVRNRLEQKETEIKDLKSKLSQRTSSSAPNPSSVPRTQQKASDEADDQTLTVLKENTGQPSGGGAPTSTTPDAGAGTENGGQAIGSGGCEIRSGQTHVGEPP